MAFAFKITGLDKVQGIFKKLPLTVRKELKAEFKLSANKMRDDAKAAAPKDQARLIGSISSKMGTGLNAEVVAQSDHAGYLEFGTKTKAVIPKGLESVAASLRGGGGGSGNPVDALEKWVRRKGIGVLKAGPAAQRRGQRARDRNKQRSIAFLIWRHIKKYGIKAQPYFFKQADKEGPLLIKRVRAVIERIIK